MSEFVGCGKLDTIALTIANIDDSIHKLMKLPKNIHALGLISSRTGAAGQIMAADEAVKMTNAKIISIELPRDTKGWGGHGNYIVLGSSTYSDVKQATQIALELCDKHAGEVYISEAGHLEFCYTASCGEAINKVFGAPIGAAFGFLAASPAAIGLLLADKAVKSAAIKPLDLWTPNYGTSHSNEVILPFTGTASDVKNAVLTARENGLKLLTAMGSYPESPSEPYIL
ncbi:MAG: microcompartment protein PduB [Clostridia bacterium]|nr:microcompartment protein PduB [Clostridia bacterium]